MRMVSDELKNLFQTDSIEKRIRIEIADIDEENTIIDTLYNSDIESESMYITEVLNDNDNIVFGLCEISEIGFTINERLCDLDFRKKILYVSLEAIDLNGQSGGSINLGAFYVSKQEKLAGKKKKKVTAYGEIQRLNIDVTKWYNNLEFPISSYDLYCGLLRYVGLNDFVEPSKSESVMIKKTIDNNQLVNGMTLINYLLELYGKYGVMKYDSISSKKGVFTPISLPAYNSEPFNIPNSMLRDYPYTEGYMTALIDGLDIIGYENSVIYDTEDAHNKYTIENNPLVYGMSDDELRTIANVFIRNTKGVSFSPAKINLKGQPYIEIGDIVYCNNEDEVQTYVFKRTLSGIQNLVDQFESYGTEYIESDSNSIIGQINRVQQSVGVVSDEIQTVSRDLVEAEKVVTKKIEANTASINTLAVDTLAVSNKLLADEAKIATLEADNVKINETLRAANADISNLKTDKLDASYAEVTNALIADLQAKKADVSSLTAINANISSLQADNVTIKSNLESANANIQNLETTKLNASYATVTDAEISNLKSSKADIDFANVEAGVISTVLIADGAITDAKILALSANKITSGEIDASKIVVKNLNADNLTVGTINGKLIGSGSVDLDKLSTEVPTKEYLDSVEKKLQDEIDGAIETFTGADIPTLNNYPVNNWKAEDYKKHIGDVYYVVNATSQSSGYTYRFAYDEKAKQYMWVLIKDSDVTKALDELLEVKGDISGLKTFESNTTSWITNTDEELSSLKTNVTNLETSVGTKVETTTFNSLKQTVDTNSSNITKLTTSVNSKASSDDLKKTNETISTVSNKVNSVEQTANSNTSKISGLTTTLTQNYSTTAESQEYVKDAVNNIHIGSANLINGSALLTGLFFYEKLRDQNNIYLLDEQERYVVD